MRKIVFESPMKAVVRQADKPVCGRGQVLLKMRRIGVCGTDICRKKSVYGISCCAVS